MQALGCVLFTLCYEKHPFEDSAKLRILNANYAFPKNDSKFVGVQELIRTPLCNFLILIPVLTLLFCILLIALLSAAPHQWLYYLV